MKGSHCPVHVPRGDVRRIASLIQAVELSMRWRALWRVDMWSCMVKRAATLLPFVMEYNMLSDLPKFAEIAVLMGENINSLNLRDAAYKGIEAVRFFLMM